MPQQKNTSRQRDNKNTFYFSYIVLSLMVEDHSLTQNGNVHVSLIIDMVQFCFYILVDMNFDH